MDQIIDRNTARGLQDDAARVHGVVGWVVSQDPPAHPGRALMARLITTMPTPYILLADTLANLRAMLPAGLERSDPQPRDPPDVLEIWFSFDHVPP